MAARPTHDSEYVGLFAEFYDHLHRSQTADVALFRALANEMGSPVLEMGCGTGRVLAPLVEDGHEVVGVDSSADMLRICRERIGADCARLVLGDMRRFETDERFHLVLLVCNTLWHCLETADALAVLCRARDALAPGGRVVVDLSVPDVEAIAAAGGEPEQLSIPAGRFVYRSELTAELDPATRIERDRIVLRKLEGDRLVAEAECRSTLRLYAPDEIRDLMEEAGLRVQDAWGSPRREPWTAASAELILVAGSP